MLRSPALGALALAFLAFSPPGRAEEARSRCIDVSIPKAEFAQREGGRWIELTSDQRLFLAGVYAMDPATPAGLPLGDKAVLATIPEHDGGLIFFVDGERACTPMAVPKELIDLLADVAGGAVRHEGGAL